MHSTSKWDLPLISAPKEEECIFLFRVPKKETIHDGYDVAIDFRLDAHQNKSFAEEVRR